MPTKLRKVTRVLLKDQSGVGTAQIVASAVTDALKVYRQGATVTTAVGPIGTGTAVAVRDTGKLYVGATVQNGTNSTHTATVASIVSRTSITLTKVGASVLNFVVGDRIVCTTSRPTIYSESTGNVSVGSSNVTTDTAGKASFYCADGMVDLIFSGTGITTDSEYDVEAGYFEPHPWLDVRDYDSLQSAYDALPSTGGTIYIASGVTCDLSAALTILKDGTRIVGDHDGTSKIRASSSNPTWNLINVWASNVWIENVELDGRGTTAASYDGITIAGTAISGVQVFNCVIRNCYIHDFRRNSIRIQGAFNTQVESTVMNWAFDHSVYIDTDGGSLNATHVRFVNCSVDGTTNAAVAALDKAAVRIASGYGVTFDFCRFESNRGGSGAISGNGIYASSTQGLRIRDCHFELASSGSYKPSTRPKAFICLEDSGGAVIEGCTFSGTSDGTIQPYCALHLYNADQAVILGGRFENLQTYLIEADAASRNIVILRPLIGSGVTGLNIDKSYLQAYEGMKVSSYTDDADRASNASTIDGTIIHVVTPTTPANKLQVRLASAWVGITGT